MNKGVRYSRRCKLSYRIRSDGVNLREGGFDLSCRLCMIRYLCWRNSSFVISKIPSLFSRSSIQDRMEYSTIALIYFYNVLYKWYKSSIYSKISQHLIWYMRIWMLPPKKRLNFILFVNEWKTIKKCTLLIIETAAVPIFFCFDFLMLYKSFNLWPFLIQLQNKQILMYKLKQFLIEFSVHILHQLVVSMSIYLLPTTHATYYTNHRTPMKTALQSCHFPRRFRSLRQHV